MVPSQVDVIWLHKKYVHQVHDIFVETTNACGVHVQ